MKKIMIITALICCFGSCHSKREKASSSSSDCELCTQSALYQSLTLYVDEFGQWGLEEMFYGVYFFEREDKNYFTTWIDFDAPYNVIENYRNSKDRFICNYLKISNCNFVFIRDKSSDVDTGIYKDCEKYFRNIKDMPLINDKIISDDSHYPATYQYEFVDGRYKVTKIQSAIIDFMPYGIIKFEEWIISKDAIREQ